MLNRDKIGCLEAIGIVLVAILLYVGVNVLLTHALIWVIQGFGGPDLTNKFWLVFVSLLLFESIFGSGFGYKGK